MATTLKPAVRAQLDKVATRLRKEHAVLDGTYNRLAKGNRANADLGLPPAVCATEMSAMAQTITDLKVAIRGVDWLTGRVQD